MIKVILLCVTLCYSFIIPVYACEVNKDLRSQLPDGVQLSIPMDVGIKQYASSDKKRFWSNSILVAEVVNETYFKICKEDLQLNYKPTYYIWYFDEPTWKLLAKSKTLFPNWERKEQSSIRVSSLRRGGFTVSRFIKLEETQSFTERYTFRMDTEQHRFWLSSYDYSDVEKPFDAQRTDPKMVKYLSASVDIYGSGLSLEEGYMLKLDFGLGKGELQAFTFARKHQQKKLFRVPKLKQFIEDVDFSDAMNLPYIREMVMLDVPKPKRVVQKVQIDAVDSFWSSLLILHKYHLSQPTYQALLQIAEGAFRKEIKHRGDTLVNISNKLSDFNLVFKDNEPLDLIYAHYKLQGAEVADYFFYKVIASTLESFDKDTYFYSPKDAKNLQASAGIGIQLDSKAGDYPIIKSIVVNSSVEESGLEIGDIVLKINDEPLINRSNSYLWLMLRGEEGKQAKLTVLTKKNVVAVYKLEYEALKKEVIEARVLDNALYIKFNQFHKDTEPDLTKVIGQVCQRGQCDKRGLIIDLRDNEGGLLRPMMQTLNLFLDKGAYMYSTQKHGKRVEKNKTWHVPRFSQVPIIILVGKHTASGAEVFAGAMQYHQRALIIGGVTTGRGKISTLIPFTSNQQMVMVKVPTAEMFIGDQTIEGQGVKPNVLYLGAEHQLPIVSQQLFSNITKEKGKHATLRVLEAVREKQGLYQGLSVYDK